MSLEFIYQREANLDNESNSTVAISGRNSIEKETFIGDERYLLSSLDLNFKSKAITNWPDCDKIKALSDLINATKKKELSHIDLTSIVKFPNSSSFENRVLTLIRKKTYKHRTFIQRL